MLKALKDTFAGTANAKCGEVYFQSMHSFRIDCAFCDMKSFVFADFLLHIQNEHFENGLLKTEALLPKQEQLDGSPHAHSQAQATTQVNPFSWYEVANDKDLPDNSENEFVDESKQLLDEDEADPVGLTNSIIKWDRPMTSATEQVRQQRALKVDYNEDIESDIENAHNGEAPLQAKKKQLACMQCNKTYQSKKSLKRHMERQHKVVDSDVAITDIEDTDNDHEDDIYEDCEPPKPDAPKPSIKYKCQHCDKVYHGKYTLRQHVKRDHDISQAEAFVCLECNAQLPRLRLLDEHVVKVHGGAPCLICGRRYKTRHELKRHQLKHTNERNVACNHAGCDKRFFTTRHMRNHSKVHSEQKNFVCESCGYSCRNKETLRVHLRSHTGERPFGCKVCDKRFPSHSGLREHMAMHSTERPHVCKVCGATFSRQKGLYHHKFLHAATKQFVCKLCGNAYAQAAGLAGHMRKHRNDELNV